MILRNNFMVILFAIVWGRIILYTSDFLAPYNFLESNPLMKLVYIIVIAATCFALAYETTFLSRSKEWVINLLSISLVPVLFTVGLLIQNQTLLFLGYGPFGIFTVGFSEYQWPAMLASYAGYGYLFVKISDPEEKYLRKYAAASISVVIFSWLIRAYLSFQWLPG